MNESVGFPAFDFAVCVTNFVAASSHLKKQESDLCFILRITPDILATHVQTVCIGCHMSYFILPVLQILFINCRWRFY